MGYGNVPGCVKFVAFLVAPESEELEFRSAVVSFILVHICTRNRV
jgi:hypothetical protein